MQVSRLVIRNYRAIKELDVQFGKNISCLIGENNTGKTAALMAMRICLDVNLSSSFRALIREDIHSSLDISHPSQVLIGIEFTDFQGKVNEEALVSTWKTGPDRARVFYRFRPKPSVRDKLGTGDLLPGNLGLEDYSWEIKGGGNPANDMTSIEWNDEAVGEGVRFGDLQSFSVTNLPALRDVENDLKYTRHSPLTKLIEAFEIAQNEQTNLIAILNEANEKIESADTIAAIAQSIDTQFKEVSGPAFSMDSRLGISAATFSSIISNLKVLLSDLTLKDFEVGRNGLGMNNILYVAILLEYLNKRTSNGNSSGQIILLEEPEAHLHPQLQSALIAALQKNAHQVILTSHSSQITSRVPLTSIISLTKRSDASILASNLTVKAKLTSNEISDLERYLDSTKSNLLFARKVMLVEGATELFLIPSLLERLTGETLERLGISLIAIHGVHFNAYTKLFQKGAIEKKCAVVADADLKPSDANEDFNPAQDAPQLAALENDFVKTFAGATTIERELAFPQNLPAFISTMEDLGATTIKARLEALHVKFLNGTITDEDREVLSDTILATAKRFGKARFAQVLTRHIKQIALVPSYINEAYKWLLE